ncbi:MAG: type I restriction enzyme HsdR N-terminal domain-containing protein [Chlamydiota bacterium]
MASSSRNETEVYDEVRRCWVRATPEEKVRQWWIQRMIHQLGFPRELIVVEKELKELPHLQHLNPPDRRLDILCYSRDLHPLLLIECKQSGAKTCQNFLDRALEQVIGYNDCVQASFIAIACDAEIRVGCRERSSSRYIFGNALPQYQELIEWVKR